MSRAFVKEDGPDNAALPDLPISPHPNYVTPRGLADLRARLSATLALLAKLKARAERLDLLPERAAERDIRFLEARLASAILVTPIAAPTEVGFGTSVTVTDEDGKTTTYEITGEDEADARLCRIAPQSPLARALMGVRIGDSVEWRRPTGTMQLEVIAIAPIPADPCP
ncbi:MAG: GreA/GreB family elongation factor [Albidovulum sp.]